MQEKLNAFSNEIISICADVRGDFGVSGRVYHCGATGAEPFQSIDDIINKVEIILNNSGVPQQAVELRSFTKKPSRLYNYRVMNVIRTPKEVVEERGKIATFLLHVKYRQNATWQGNIMWIERDMTMSFRSVLELLKLIDSAIDS